MINFDTAYNNETSPGRLIPLLFEVNTTGITYPFYVQIHVESEHIVAENPMTVSIQRGSFVLSEKLPTLRSYDGESYQYNFFNGTLCENDDLHKEFNGTIEISIASGSPLLFNFQVHARKYHKFRISQVLDVSASPSAPVFYRYVFPEGVETVNVEFNSNDDICGQLYVRQAHCPIFDSENRVEEGGPMLYQTVTRKGFITVKKSVFGDKFHVILTINPTNSKCGKNPDSWKIITNEQSLKNGTLRIFPVSEHFEWVAALLFIIVGFVLLGITVILIKFTNNQMMFPPIPEFENEERPNSFLWYMIGGSFVPLLYIVFYPSIDETRTSNLDTCIHNYQCAWSFWIFPSVNPVISSFSILFVGGIVYLYGLFNTVANENADMRRERRLTELFLIALCNLGFLWCIMNICPQQTTFHIYTYSTTLLTLTAMFSLIGKRDGLKNWHVKYIALVSVRFGMAVFLDRIFPEQNFYWGSKISKVWLFLFVLYQRNEFALNYGGIVSKYPGLRYYLKKLNFSYVEPPEGDQVALNDEEILSIQMKSWFEVLSFISYVIWNILLISHTIENITTCILRSVQLEFVIFIFCDFIRKCRNPRETMKRNYIIQISACFVLFFSLCVFWGVISTSLLPSFIPHPPAWSRAMNQECFASRVPLDWQDVLHFVSALIGLCFLWYLKIVDSNIEIGQDQWALLNDDQDNAEQVNDDQADAN